MRKHKIITGLAVLLLPLLLMGFTKTDFKRDFVSFDQAFIPPLALTNQEKVKPSKKAMKILSQNWDVFRAKYYDANPQDSKWKEDFDKIDKVILEAKTTVGSGKHLMSAHETLEEVRWITLELRKRNHIDYYLDPLTEFHAHMEEIFHMGNDNSPEDIGSDEINTLKETLAEAEKVWTTVKSADFDPSVYGFNDQKMAKMKKLLKLESDALNNLKQALESGDKAAVIKAAKGIKPNYAKLYKLFGNFGQVMG
ncbi:hypothetical protein N9174_01340 [bacterium]|nr:hypothetical protein [bacterium]